MKKKKRIRTIVATELEAAAILVAHFAGVQHGLRGQVGVNQVVGHETCNKFKREREREKGEDEGERAIVGIFRLAMLT